MLKKVVPLVLTASLLAGCASDMGQKQGVGSLGGAVAGGLAGSAFGSGTGKMVAVGIGSVLGAFLGGEMGRSLDRADQLYANQAASTAYSAPVGQTINWNNPDSGNSGQITTTRDGYQQGSNAYCREYSQAINVGGRTQTAHGTACQQPDGTWKIVS